MEVRFESKGDFDAVRKWLDDVSNRAPAMALTQIAGEGERNLSSNTPRDTGETASGWVATISHNEIAWSNGAHSDENINLAVAIDKGYGTGTGGYVPARPYIKRSMESVWKHAGDTIVKELIK